MSARAQLATLATTPGDGSVVMQVDAYGGFGYTTYGNGRGGAGDAMYDPVGSVGPSSTTWQSAVYFRQPPQSSFMTTGRVGQATPSGNLPDPGFSYQNGTTAMSAFAFRGLNWQLTQTLEDINDTTGARVGSQLVQAYTIRNDGATTITFDLVRYYEGDLWLGSGAGVPDGGGRLFSGTQEILFETDLAGQPSTTTNFVGITACGGVTPLSGRYEVNQWSAFPNRITADIPLGDVVHNDGPDADQFVDAGLDYDVGIALCNQFSIPPLTTASYLTTTLFGFLPPSSVTTGCLVNGPAVAVAGPDQTTCPGTLVTLDGTGSFDTDANDGGIWPTWTWDLDTSVDSSGDTVPDNDLDALGPTVTASFPVGTTTVKLTYTDDEGDVATDTMTVTAVDAGPPTLTCPGEIDTPATSFAGAPVTVLASATDDCDATPLVVNDRTPNGLDASGQYPCGPLLVTFTATDEVGNTSTCSTLVRVLAQGTPMTIGPTLRVSKQPGGTPVLDWSSIGTHPPEVRYTVLRETARTTPTTPAPGAAALDLPTWTETDTTPTLIFYDVRSVLCDGTKSAD